MKILITGVSGLLGAEVWNVFSADHDVTGVGRQQPSHVPSRQWRKLDLTDTRQTYAVITRENPDCVIHCAAYNDVDGAEKMSATAYHINAYGTRNVALACQRFDTVLLSVSTDYVFDGHSAPAEGYREFDPAHPLGVYAQSKRWGEMFVESLLNKYFIVRTAWLFGPSRPTYVDKVLELARQNKSVPCVKDMVSSPTYTPDLAKAFLLLIESARYGIYHLTNGGFCSRVELAQEVLRMQKVGDEKLLQKVTQADLRMAAPRPTFSGLNNLAWTLDGFPRLRPWKEALRDHFTSSKVTS